MTAPVEPPCRWWHSALGYLTVVAVTVGLLVAGMHLHRADFSSPFAYDSDALLILPMAKAVVERGSHWRNERLGAPGIQELHDFPVVDHLHFAGIWLIGQFTPNAVVAFNLYYLLTFPLTAVVTMAVFRRFGISVLLAGAAGLLYAFQPYHYLRGEVHYFLSAYYVLPLAMMVALWTCLGTLPFFPTASDGSRRFRLRDRRGWAAVVIALLTASAGAYYAFFSCAVLAAAGVYGWAAVGTWRAAAAAGLVIAAVAVGGVANHLPTFAYHAKYGDNTRPTTRLTEEAELYGMKLAQLVLPVAGHNWQPLNRLRAEYDSRDARPCQNENEFSPLGLIGTVGLIGLLVSVFLPGRRPGVLRAVAGLTLFSVLLGTMGGVGSLYAQLVSPQVRCFNRVSIVIAFFALFTVAWVLNRWVGRRPRVGLAVAVLLIGVGLWDQLNNQWFRPTGYAQAMEATAEKYRTDRAFFEEVEERLADVPDAEAAVFTFPYVQYPEATPVEGVAAYDHVRGYLHTRRLRWSFGAMAHREWDNVLRVVSDQPPPRMLARLIRLGFRGLLLDRRGLPPARCAAFEEELRRALGGGERVCHPDGRLVFYDLRSYAAAVIGSSGREAFDRAAAAERERVSVLWLKGFFCYQPVGKENHGRLARKAAQIVFVNPTDTPRVVRIRFMLATLSDEPTAVTFAGDIWSEEFPVVADGRAVVVERSLTVPPGHHRVNVRARPPAGFYTPDSRRLFLVFNDFEMTDGG